MIMVCRAKLRLNGMFLEENKKAAENGGKYFGHACERDIKQTAAQQTFFIVFIYIRGIWEFSCKI